MQFLVWQEFLIFEKFSGSSHVTKRSSGQYVWDVYVTKFWQMFLETIDVADKQVTDPTLRYVIGAFSLLRMGKQKKWLCSAGNPISLNALIWGQMNWKRKGIGMALFKFISLAITFYLELE